MSHEELFDQIARQEMAAYFPAGFKRQYKTLHAVILKAMDEAGKQAVANQLKPINDGCGEIISQLKKELSNQESRREDLRWYLKTTITALELIQEEINKTQTP
jgi:hypothetical protein